MSWFWTQLQLVNVLVLTPGIGGRRDNSGSGSSWSMSWFPLQIQLGNELFLAPSQLVSLLFLAPAPLDPSQLVNVLHLAPAL